MSTAQHTARMPSMRSSTRNSSAKSYDGSQKSKNDTTMKQKPKRKRKRQTASSRLQERQERFQKLDTVARRQIRREAKVVRTFLCQKWVRKLKENDADEKRKKSREEEEEVWKVIKSIDLDAVVQHVLDDKLGYYLLEPTAKKTTTTTRKTGTDEENQEEEDAGDDVDDEDDNDSQDEDENNENDTTEDDDNNKDDVDSGDAETRKQGGNDTTRKTKDDGDEDTRKDVAKNKEEEKEFGAQDLPPQGDAKKRYDTVLKLFFQHKRLQTVMKQVNDKIAEYRCWVLQQEDNEQGRRRANTRDRPMHIPTSSLFVGSLSSSRHQGHDQDSDEEKEDGPPKKRQNRKGQRARRAKALAVQAAKEGRAVDKSHNWRDKTKKKKKRKIDQAASEASNDDAAAAAATAHPSWAAAKQAKVGIVKFEGTKIKFD